MKAEPGAAGSVPRLHRVEQVMGMPIIVDVHDASVPTAALDRVFDWFRRVDALFSTYRDDSEISLLNRGMIALEGCSPIVRRVLEHCHRLRGATDGYFDHRAAGAWEARRREGVRGPFEAVDPSGLVKGWAVDGAAEILEQAGARSYCVDAAGDMRLAGRPPGCKGWRVGIQHPHDPSALAAVLQTETRAAIATSATYVRGQHIVDPWTGAAPAGLMSVTVVGEADLATADAYATAVFAMGSSGPEWAAAHIAPYEALMIDDHDTIHATAGLGRWRQT